MKSSEMLCACVLTLMASAAAHAQPVTFTSEARSALQSCLSQAIQAGRFFKRRMAIVPLPEVLPLPPIPGENDEEVETPPPLEPVPVPRSNQRLVLECYNNEARQLYTLLARWGIQEEIAKFDNHDKGFKRDFGESVCFRVTEAADRTQKNVTGCRLVLDVGDLVLGRF